MCLLIIVFESHVDNTVILLTAGYDLGGLLGSQWH